MSRPPYPTTVYQRKMAKILRRLFPSGASVETEWRSITNIAGLYAPRVDVAVGPFSVIRGGNCTEEHNALIKQFSSLLNCLLDEHKCNVRTYASAAAPFDGQRSLPSLKTLTRFNHNARCFLAIEIENRVSRKHLLGGAVNASALGRIGVVIGWTKDKVKALVRLLDYWQFLGNVGKNTFSTDNLLILDPDQFQQALVDSLETAEGVEDV